jgi:saccharopine dehydrogenase (NAD+, L-lysine-forming)
MKEADFRIKTISDITCDIAPDSSIPSTVYASSIADPYYGYHPTSESLMQTFMEGSIDMMAIDNLPNELPRDASEDFGNMLVSRVLPEFRKADGSSILAKATIASSGKLCEDYLYMSDYAYSV